MIIGKKIRKVTNFYQSKSQVNGIVACDDITGLTVQQILIESGIDLEKYEIVTFNNSIYTQIAKPMITAVEIFQDFRIRSSCLSNK